MSLLDPARWRAASTHLDSLLDATPEVRASRLAALERTDPQVAADVAVMLASHEQVAATKFLETGPVGPRGQADAGDLVGSYRLVEPIGQGGMGSVWLAERADGRFEGRAAVKLLNASFLDRAGEARFTREGTILARLTHPNIARLIDAGVSASGHPFLVLEYIDGTHIDEFVHAQRLDVAACLRLFLDVLAAVSHAHANLIVHRDLKPSNVLVTRDGHVKLLDFGIATLLQRDDAAITQITREAGLTPKYASPEQMLGRDVTTATDVYALGVLLYTLLAGRHPAGDGPLAPAELVRSIVDVSPPPVSHALADPSAVRRRALEGDVDTIVAKALKKAPEERYASVSALADDIRRVLRHEPISARPDTVAYRTARFLRRHRRAVIAAAAAGTLVIASSVYYTVRLRAERDRATLEARKAERVSELLTSLLTASDPYRTPGVEPTVGALLDAGAGRIDTELADLPEVRAELLTVVGRVYHRMGRDAQARPLLERALALGRGLAPAGNAKLAQTLNDLGVMTRDHGDAAAGLALLEESLAMRRRVLGPDHADLAVTLVEVARAMSDLGRGRDSEPHIREALAIRKKIFGDQHRETATSKAELGLLLWNRGELIEAEQMFRQNLDTCVAVLGPRHPNTAAAQSNLALVLAATGRADEAERLTRAALAANIERLGPRHVAVAHSYYNLSVPLLKQGRLREALAAARTAVDLGRAVLDRDHPRLAAFEVGLGRVLLADHRPREAEPFLRHALSVRSTALRRDDWRIAQANALLGASLFDQRRRHDAEPFLRAASAGLADQPGPQGDDKRATDARLATYAVR